MMFIFTIILIEIAIWAETDIFVPTMPMMVEFFKISEQHIQLILSINFFGLFISAFLAGPISDRFGPKKIILIGMIIFAISSLGCAICLNFELLLLLRFIQGIGAGIPMVLAWVLMINKYSEEKIAYISGIVNSCTTAIMAGAPIIGAYLGKKFSWHANFYLISAIAVISIIFCHSYVDDSFTVTNRKKLNIKNIFQDYLELAKKTTFIANMLLSSLSYSCIMVYIANSSIIFINHMRINEKLFSYLQASTMCTYMIGSAISSKLIAKYGINRTNNIGCLVIVSGAFMLFATSILYEKSVYFICLFMNIYTIGVSISINIISLKAMHSISNIKGTASGFFTITRLIIISLLIQLTSIFYTGSILPIASIIFIITLLMIFIYKAINRIELE